jgi:hypothetical protein
MCVQSRKGSCLARTAWQDGTLRARVLWCILPLLNIVQLREVGRVLLIELNRALRILPGHTQLTQLQTFLRWLQ